MLLESCDKSHAVLEIVFKNFTDFLMKNIVTVFKQVFLHDN